MKLKSVSIQEIVLGNFSIWSDQDTEVGLVEVFPSTRARGSMVVSLYNDRQAVIEWDTDNAVIQMKARLSFKNQVFEGGREHLLVEQQALYPTTIEWIVALGEEAVDLLDDHSEEQEQEQENAATKVVLEAIEQLKTFARENPRVAKRVFREVLDGFAE